MARDGYILVILLGVPMDENIKCKTNDRKKELNKMIYRYVIQITLSTMYYNNIYE